MPTTAKVGTVETSAAAAVVTLGIDLEIQRGVPSPVCFARVANLIGFDFDQRHGCEIDNGMKLETMLLLYAHVVDEVSGMTER